MASCQCRPFRSNTACDGAHLSQPGIILLSLCQPPIEWVYGCLWYSFGRAVSRRFQGCQEQHSQLEGNQRNIAISPDYSQFWTQTSDTTVVDLFHKLDTHTHSRSASCLAQYGDPYRMFSSRWIPLKTSLRHALHSSHNSPRELLETKATVWS